MHPVICRCCGVLMETGSPDNPNICLACAAAEWSDPQEFIGVRSTGEVSATRTETLGAAPRELEDFLEVEGPSVIECFDATELAKEAIAESVASEKAAAEQSAHAVQALPQSK